MNTTRTLPSMMLGLLLLGLAHAAQAEVATQADASVPAEPPPAAVAPATPAAPGPFSADNFLATSFAEAFRARDYTTALALIEGLAKEYPNDPLIMRYHAITLGRVNRFDEAFAIFEQLRATYPEDIATRYSYGETLYLAGRDEQALQEWQWVLDNSPIEEYREWSQTLIERVKVVAGQPSVEERWYVVADVGMEYDTNAILKPNDKGVAAQEDKSANRYVQNYLFGYRAIVTPNYRMDITSTTRISLHDDGLTEVNFFSQELALDNRWRVRLRSQDVVLGLQLSESFGELDWNLFTQTQQVLGSADTSFFPRTRSVFYTRLSYIGFGPDGSNPPQTSRDGFYHDYGTTQYLYSADYRRYIFASHEFNFAATRGANFERTGTTSRLGVHTPLRWRTDLDASGGFQWGRYPRFESLSALDRLTRVDQNWDLGAALTHHLTSHVDVRAVYRYFNANNRNDFFQYDRHIFGLHVIYAQAF